MKRASFQETGGAPREDPEQGTGAPDTAPESGGGVSRKTAKSSSGAARSASKTANTGHTDVVDDRDAPEGAGAASGAGEPETAEHWRQRFEAEAAAHRATRDRYAKEQDRAETARLLRDALAAEGVQGGLAGLVLDSIDPDSVLKKDGQLENWPELRGRLRGRYAGLFGEVRLEGAAVGSPPVGQGAPVYSLAQIRNMSPGEINRHWKEIQKTLSKGR